MLQPKRSLCLTLHFFYLLLTTCYLLTGCASLGKVNWLVLRDETGTTVKKEMPLKQVPGYRVQISASGNLNSAKSTQQTADTLIPGVRAYIVEENNVYKVRLGDYTNKPEAIKLRDQLVKLGYSECWVTPGMVYVPVTEPESTTTVTKSTKVTPVSVSIPELKYTSEILSNIRIGILRNRPMAIVYCKGNASLYDKTGNAIVDVKEWNMWTVRVKTLPGSSGSESILSGTTVFRAQACAYGSEEYAIKEADKIRTQLSWPVYVVNEPPYYKVRVGAAKTRDEVTPIIEKLKSIGYDGAWIHSGTSGTTGGTNPKFKLEVLDPEENVYGEYDEFVTLQPKDKDSYVACGGRLFRNNLEIRMGNDGLLSVINQMHIDQYLYGVVPAEIGTSAGTEALKAQAVAARTETLAKLGKHKNDGFDLCADVDCQVYGGVSRETVQTNKAVDDTVGEVLVHNGKLAGAVYHACCGGFTENSEIVWSGNPTPYLVSVPCFPDGINTEFRSPLNEEQFIQWVTSKPETFCTHATRDFRWVKEFTQPELQTLLNKTFNLGDLLDIKLGNRGPGGTLKLIEIIGTKGTFKVERENKIRTVLGGVFDFRSGKFILEKPRNPAGIEMYRFIGAGWGHGVGMCQDGAMGMSDRGKTYREILLHYYHGTEIKKVYTSS